MRRMFHCVDEVNAAIWMNQNGTANANQYFWKKKIVSKTYFEKKQQHEMYTENMILNFIFLESHGFECFWHDNVHEKRFFIRFNLETNGLSSFGG